MECLMGEIRSVDDGTRRAAAEALTILTEDFRLKSCDLSEL